MRSLDYGTVGGNPYIVMEYCSGGDLTPYLGSGSSKIPLICQQILIGLHALHTRGKVHRDLKPENVLFKSNGIAALTDFGIAGDRNKRMTERNIFGKPNQIFGTWLIAGRCSNTSCTDWKRFLKSGLRHPAKSCCHCSLCFNCVNFCRFQSPFFPRF